MRVLVSCLLMVQEAARFRPFFEAHGVDVVFQPSQQFLRRAELLPILGKFDGMVAGDDELTEEVLASARPRLQVISKWGVGLDSIDLPAAKKLGIQVFNSPGAFNEAVADVTLGYLLMLTRKLHRVDQAVRRGEWPKPEGTGLRGRTMGLIGFGGIGQTIAQRARAFGMDILAYDVRDGLQVEGGRQVSLDDLLTTSDVVCLACSLNAENIGLVGRAELAKMKRGSYLINVARGPLVDQDALVESLQNGHLAGAALDVYRQEPLPREDPLCRMDHVVLGSHNANNLATANEAVHRNTLGNLFRGLGLEVEVDTLK